MKRRYIVGSVASFALSVSLAVMPLTASAQATFTAGSGSSSSIHIERLTSDSRYSIPRSASASVSTGISMLSDSVFPSTYDLRSLGQSTSVKHQGEFGTCWAFSSIASFESALLKQRGGNAQTTDLSELQVAYFQNWRATDEEASKLGAKGQGGEGTEYKGAGTHLTGGGNAAMAASIISRGTGVISESRAPYKNAEGTISSYNVYDWNGSAATESVWSESGDWSVDRSLSTASEYQLAETGFGLIDTIDAPGIGKVSDTSYVSDMKATIMDKGAVALSLAHPVAGASYDWDVYADEYTNISTGARFVNIDAPSNHMVTVVGWDDNFDKSNFNIEPPANGAWIVKNSYGSESSYEGNVSAWGIDRSGYFYLSYYDASLEDFSWMTPVAAADETSITMQYDLLGAVSGETLLISLDEEAGFANVFTADCDMELKAVSASSPCSGMSVDAYIYLLSDANEALDEGVLLASAHKDMDDLLYSRIQLDKPVSIKAGETFSVVEFMHGDIPAAGAGESWTMSFEVGYENGYTDAIGMSCTAVSNPGESYVKLDGEWRSPDVLEEADFIRHTPYEIGNAMIKAFADPVDLSGWDRLGGAVFESGNEGVGSLGGSSDSANDGGISSGDSISEVENTSGINDAGTNHPMASFDNTSVGVYPYTGGSVQTSGVSQGAAASVVASDPKLAQTGDSLPGPLFLFSALCALSSVCFIFAGIRESEPRRAA